MLISSPRPGRPAVLWRQVAGLCALQGAVGLSFTAYDLYQPQLLLKFGFHDLAMKLALQQGALTALVAPLAGAWSDRSLRRGGSRYPTIYLGVLVAGLLFVTVALGVRRGALPAGSRLLPGLILCWVAAMAVFQSPSLSLLKRFAVPQQLPRAAALLTLVGGALGALGPLLLRALQHLGAALTFFLGAVLLGTGALVLRWLVPRADAEGAPAEGPGTGSSAGLQVVFVFGLLCGGFGSLAQAALKRGAPLSFSVDGAMAAAAASLVATVLAFPGAAVTVRLGQRAALLLGIAALLGVQLLLGGAGPSRGAVVIAVLLLGAAQALVGTSAVPYALTRVPGDRVGLGAGLYAGGAAAAAALGGAWLMR